MSNKDIKFAPKNTRMTIKRFIRFLKDNNAYTSYLDNCRDRCRLRRGRIYNFYNGSIIAFFIDSSRYNKGELIDYAFDWSLTPQGHEFWGKLDIKWRAVCVPPSSVEAIGYT